MKFVLVIMLLTFPATLFAQSEEGFWSRIRITTLEAASPKSEDITLVRSQGYELEQGEYVDLRKWYSPKKTPLMIKGVAQISNNVLLHWGAATGENGEKYSIDPSLFLGFTYQHSLSEKTQILISAERQFGGRLEEETCTAEYTIGGVQEVNCRMAASALKPQKTLDYLLSSSRPEMQISLKLIYNF